ncbi:MAG: peptide chain release factor 1 [Bacilli bacterium]
MINRLNIILKQYNLLKEEQLKPEIYNDFTKMSKISKELNSYEEIVAAFTRYNQILSDIETAKEMSKEIDMHDFAMEEIDKLNEELSTLESNIKIMLLPKDINDDKNVIIEIRGAAGGDEANLFAGDLFKMYSKYAEKQDWKLEVTNEVPGESGGYSQIEFILSGESVYSKMKYESGSHRVQRVPETESQGRVHTSTATVLVMPEASEIDIEIKESDLKIDVFHSSGAGGQSVNTTDSAVRITHLPTNTVVNCQNERSQLKNKAKAMQILKTRLYEMKLREQEEALGSDRKNKIGSGDRSEKIRTYNYPQNRLTDHRIGYTNMNLDKLMEGHIDELLDSLITENQKAQMSANNDKTNN